jgi:polysaccharide export outer membrane protein
MRLGRLLVLLITAFAAAGCARAPLATIGEEPQVAAAPQADLDSLMYARGGPRPVVGPVSAVVAAPVAAIVPEPVVAVVPPYTLDSGDKLRIVVFGQEGLTSSYVVDAAGNITMPLIGRVAARGATTEELARAVAARLRNGFVREPHVAIEIESYRPFFILGEVTAPGQYPYVPNMTVETAVAIAGGFTPRAYHGDVKISHNTGGMTLLTEVPLIHPVTPGDTITIKERWF